MNLDNLTYELRGYKNHTNEIDREIAESERCPHCGKRMEYLGAKQSESYRAFAICVGCYYAEEF